MSLHVRVITTQLITRNGILIARTLVSNATPKSHLEALLSWATPDTNVLAWVSQKAEHEAFGWCASYSFIEECNPGEGGEEKRGRATIRTHY